MQTRRTFLKAAAGAVAAPTIISSSALGLCGTVAPSNRLTFALIGCGGMGRANLRSFLGHDVVEVLALADPDRRRCEGALGDVRNARSNPSVDLYNDYRDLLGRDDIDCVIQATPDHWHAKVVIDAARAGKDIYGEKPLSLTIHEGRVMSDTVRRYARVFQTGSQQRSDRRFRHACELVRNGYIGRVHTVTCGLPTGSTTGWHPEIPVPDGFDYDLWLGPAPKVPYCENRTHFNFRWILDYSGGQVTDWGAHHIDIAHWGLGFQETGPVHVEGEGTFPTDGLWNAATEYRFVCTYEDGTKIVVTNDFENGVRFEGDDGWIFVSRGRIEASDPTLLSKSMGPADTRLYHEVGHRQDFIDCVASRREPVAPIEQAHRTISVAHLGNIAMQLQRPVKWDPTNERMIDDDDAQRMTSRAMRAPYAL